MAPGVDVTFNLVAVTPDQIREWHLPTRPTKKTDTRANKFRGRSVEVDAVAPSKLRELCEECITRHIDSSALDRMQRVEDAERDTLATIVGRLEGNGDE
jgi:hypothetical protein